MGERPTILVFDSGLGGLTVHREIAAVRPDADFVYLADDAAFPYGAMAEPALITRLIALLDEAIAMHKPDLIVIACNTASTIALPQLRKKFTVPFVGTVPAIKPACAVSLSKRVSVLGTQATIAREYTRALIRDFANGSDVTLVGSAELAPLAEAELRGESVDDAAVARELAPCFVDAGGRRTDTIVLACTHYPLLIDRFTRLARWPVRFIDPAPAIARRVLALLGGPQAGSARVPARIVFTSGRSPSPALAASLARFGIGEVAEGRFDTPSLSA
jgi:glutamate racemase